MTFLFGGCSLPKSFFAKAQYLEFAPCPLQNAGNVFTGKHRRHILPEPCQHDAAYKLYERL